MNWNRFSIILTLLLQTVSSVERNHSNNENVPDHSKVLSRRKRFLLFPEGSSFQLVFCLQTSAVIPIGDIFLFGSTAALAWMLPMDPEFLTMIKDHKIQASRRDGKGGIIYLDQDGNVLGKVAYKRKQIINPAFAKRSIDEESFKEKLKIKIDRMKMHEKQLNREYLKREHMDERSVEFHRNSRVGLYEKLEKLFSALGWDGRQCILRKLCESARGGLQGTFLQELLRVIFTLPKGGEFTIEEHKAYDEAHGAADNCTTLYPGCDDMERGL